jgi:PIN domain nuclease of toxin-antitoxin system
MIYLDTHVVVWLYGGELGLLSETARREIELNRLLISPAVELEIEFLYEIGRIKTGARKITDFLKERIGLEKCTISFDRVVRSSMAVKWTRDPFDRLIVGQAALQSSSLLTNDEVIRSNYSQSVW